MTPENVREARLIAQGIKERMSDPLGHGYDLKEATKLLSRVARLLELLTEDESVVVQGSLLS